MPLSNTTVHPSVKLRGSQLGVAGLQAPFTWHHPCCPLQLPLQPQLP